jgi:UDP-N-acetylglucosamine 2-epimerase (non-hydrolysing)
MTVHRQENTDNENRLLEIINTSFECAKNSGYKCVFPVHPRTRQRLQAKDYIFPENVIVIDPVGYHDFLILEKHARIIVTDSGGLQEESCILNIPCITLRENTERPETVQIGANILAGVTGVGIKRAFETTKNHSRTWTSPYGGGTASARILDAILATR